MGTPCFRAIALLVSSLNGSTIAQTLSKYRNSEKVKGKTARIFLSRYFRAIALLASSLNGSTIAQTLSNIGIAKKLREKQLEFSALAIFALLRC